MVTTPATRITDRTSHIVPAVAALAAALTAACAGADALLNSPVMTTPAGGAVAAGVAAGLSAMGAMFNLIPPTGAVPSIGFPTVLTGSLPQARTLDAHGCFFHGPNTVIEGAMTVLTGGLPTARVMSKTACSAMCSSGQYNVLIGGSSVTIPINVNGTDAFRLQVQNAAATLYGTPSGREIFRGIAASGNMVEMHELSDPNGYCTPNDGTAATDGTGTGSRVDWNPTYDDRAAYPGQTPTIVLGHELVHAYHNANGTQATGPMDSYPGQTGSSNRGEERATVGTRGTSITDPSGNPATVPDHGNDVPTENSIRRDLGVPERQTYYPPTWPGGAPW
ncbi:M91 family zinc metallopeptidase [Vannielia litorea]|uniref:Zn-binding Pro-Ala-Ala-Arg (PAAR) domain-containing protein, incolved in TypeVI secretion n=1 Tax=Vannielia litorea TaxID=1217970 RepID=A0A1N6FH90_9RHOB|nr:M91 family zinc metallopeptidase [Vannielia litorea]SIN94576.1 Zn-binding Pro-Ala-Ala-Arg (PAAR) domain-containing protein, incolved in TypeVI secretion [Vannielia litorea]